MSPFPVDDPDAWQYAGTHNPLRLTIAFEPTLPPGTRVWIVARWMSRRSEVGPFGRPVSVCLGESFASPAGPMRALSLPACSRAA